MRTGGRYTIPLLRDGFFTRFYLGDGGLTVANFVPADQGAATYSDALAADMLQPAQLSKARWALFTAKQIGAKGAPLYRLQGTQRYEHGNDYRRGLGEGRGLQVWCIASDVAGNLMAPFNITTDNAAAKTRALSPAMRTGHTMVAYIFAPYEDSRWADCTVLTFCSASLGGWHNVPCELTGEWYGDQWLAQVSTGIGLFMPRLQLMGPATLAAGAIAEYIVTVLDPIAGAPMTRKPVEVFLEASAGYLPKRRVVADQDATFKLRALDLESGDEIKLKAGWRNYSGAAEIRVKVT